MLPTDVAHPPSKPGLRWEVPGLLLCLALAAWFLSIRIATGPMPVADEGSWLAVAAELANGEGFKTRWLEFHYLTPYELPRPDDMRFPVLSALLALWFKIAGYSLEGARLLMACLFLAFMASAWYAVRLRWGALAAFLTAWLMALSPMQLEWSSYVMCEGVFGLVLSLWLIWIQKAPAVSRLHWAFSGVLVAVLCLVRTNGILLLPGVMLGALHAHRTFARAWRPMLIALAGFLLVASPWLLRNWIVFGNPFHVGGSAGLLRDAHTQDATLTVWQFLSRYGWEFPIRRVILGFVRMLQALHFYDQGLQILPLALCLPALIRRQPFFPPAAAWGFGISYAACLYAAYNSWAGVRYFSPFLPFLYAYGISQGLDLLSRAGRIVPRTLMARAPWAGALKAGSLALLLALPVINAHRFYLRHFPSRSHPSGPQVEEYLRELHGRLPANRAYLAARLCQVNFRVRDLCVGLQGPRMEEWLPRSLDRFQPEFLALTPAESADSLGRAVFAGLGASGRKAEAVFSNGIGILYRIAPARAAPGTEPGR